MWGNGRVWLCERRFICSCPTCNSFLVSFPCTPPCLLGVGASCDVVLDVALCAGRYAWQCWWDEVSRRAALRGGQGSANESKGGEGDFKKSNFSNLTDSLFSPISSPSHRTLCIYSTFSHQHPLFLSFAVSRLFPSLPASQGLLPSIGGTPAATVSVSRQTLAADKGSSCASRCPCCEFTYKGCCDPTAHRRR